MRNVFCGWSYERQADILRCHAIVDKRHREREREMEREKERERSIVEEIRGREKEGKL